MMFLKAVSHHRRIAVVAAFVALAAVQATLTPRTAVADVVSYATFLSGAAEAPPNASAGTGFAQVDLDPVAHTMRVFASFEGLGGVVTAAHIHAPTAVAGTGTAGVATQTPTFPGFPAGVSAGLYDATFDMTQVSSYSAAFFANQGGSAAGAEAALFQTIADGKAYLNIHSNLFPGGEIRGFLLPLAVAEESTGFGSVKALFR